MRYARIIGGGVVAAAAAGLLPACQVDKDFPASCSTFPPLPDREDGVVFVSADIPVKVRAGSTFTVTVDAMGATTGDFEILQQGTLGVSGGVLPAGNFVVGEGPFQDGPPFPVELELTAAGDPGDLITLEAVEGKGVIGPIFRGSVLTCTPDVDATIARIQITQPTDPQDFVLGEGTAQLESGGVVPFDFDLRGGASPVGTVSFGTLFGESSATCLDVRTRGVGTEFDEATMNLQTSTRGLVTLQVSDGNPEGLPDFISGITNSSRSPSDCSPIVFGTENLKAVVETGDVFLFNAGG